MDAPMSDLQHQPRQAEGRELRGLSRRLFLQVAGAMGALGGGLVADAAPAGAQPKVAKEALKTVAEVAGAEVSEAQLEKLMTPLEGYFKAVSEMRKVDAGDVEPITVFLMREE